MFLAR